MTTHAVVTIKLGKLCTSRTHTQLRGMGQYYVAVFLDPKNNVTGFMSSWTYGSGSKLGQHAYPKDPFVNAVAFELSPAGRFHKSRVAWAGDGAVGENLHAKCQHMEEVPVSSVVDKPSLHFLVNHSKKLVVELTPGRHHPLPLLSAEGDLGESGDVYKVPFIGTWARDVLSVESAVPDHFEELTLWGEETPSESSAGKFAEVLAALRLMKAHPDEWQWVAPVVDLILSNLPKVTVRGDDDKEQSLKDFMVHAARISLPKYTPGAKDSVRLFWLETLVKNILMCEEFKVAEAQDAWTFEHQWLQTTRAWINNVIVSRDAYYEARRKIEEKLRKRKREEA